MYRSHSCGELRADHNNTEVTLSGWVQGVRDKGFMIYIDLRDRYGITQLYFDEERTPKEIMEKAQKLGREYVIQAKGTVIERASKNPNIPTGDIEVLVSELKKGDLVVTYKHGALPVLKIGSGNILFNTDT